MCSAVRCVPFLSNANTHLSYAHSAVPVTRSSGLREHSMFELKIVRINLLNLQNSVHLFRKRPRRVDLSVATQCPDTRKPQMSISSVALVRLFCRIPESFDLRRYNSLCWHVTSLVRDSSESLRWSLRNCYDRHDLGDTSVPSRFPPLGREATILTLLTAHRVLSLSFAQVGQLSFKANRTTCI